MSGELRPQAWSSSALEKPVWSQARDFSLLSITFLTHHPGIIIVVTPLPLQGLNEITPAEPGLRVSLHVINYHYYYHGRGSTVGSLRDKN